MKEPRFSEPLIDEDGRTWLIPVARRMPQVMFKESNGELGYRSHPRYADYFERTLPFWNNLFSVGPGIPEEQYWNFCHLALQQNYRITEEVIAYLGILATNVAAEIPRVACDVKAIEEEVKAIEAERGAEKNAHGGD